MDSRFGLFCLMAEAASIALTQRLKSRRLLIAQADTTFDVACSGSSSKDHCTLQL